jgi:hypothetical protein
LAVTISGIPLLALESMTLPGGTLYISMFQPEADKSLTESFR